MKTIQRALFLFIFFTTILSFAQNSDRQFIGFSEKESHIEVKTNDGLYIIKPYSDKIIETAFIPNGETYNSVSHAVVLKPNGIKYSVSEKANQIELNTSGISVSITKRPFQIAYYYKNNELISERQKVILKQKNTLC